MAGTKAALMVVCLLSVASTVAGCGQKGPLYREAPEATSGSPGASESDDKRSERSAP